MSDWLTTTEMFSQIQDGQIAETADEQYIQRRDKWIFWIDDNGRVDTSKGFDGVFVATFDGDWKLKQLIHLVETDNWETEDMETIRAKVIQAKVDRF